jgi:sulfotransferase
MSKLIPMCGLPRSGSTLLVNLLNQNPEITVSPDSILSSLVLSSQESFTNSVSESQYDSDTSYEMFYNFCRSGINSWVDTICNTSYYIDKCRGWGHEVDLLVNMFPNIKFIYTIRDLRGIASSIEKIQKSTPMKYKDEFFFGDQNYDYSQEDLYLIKVKNIFESSMIRRNLICIKEILDIRREHFDRIYVVRYEDLILNPNETMENLYDHLEIAHYKHDLKNIEQIKYHDSFYLPYGRHKIKKALEPSDPYIFSIPNKIQTHLIDTYSWYYEEFYRDQI